MRSRQRYLFPLRKRFSASEGIHICSFKISIAMPRRGPFGIDHFPAHSAHRQLNQPRQCLDSSIVIPMQGAQ